jgi:hypothetical protein
MIYPKLFVAVVLAAPLSFVITAGPRVARAAGDCIISADDLSAIQAIQSNPNLSYLDEINQELAARKQLLSKTITCAKNEAQSLKSEVNDASVAAADKNLQNQLSGKIDDAINYYNIELGKLDGSGIRGSEQIAEEVLSWRATTYAGLASNVDNFILWSQNQNLFQTASARMAQITPMISFLSQAGNNDLASAFAAARTSFSTAENENASARNALAESLSPDQTLAVIKQSLQSLSDTYQNLFNVSDVIHKLLAGASQN